MFGHRGWVLVPRVIILLLSAESRVQTKSIGLKVVCDAKERNMRQIRGS